MASIAGISLEVENPKFGAGAAYHLSKPARITYRWVDVDGSEVMLHRGKSYVAAFLTTPPAHVDTVRAVTFDVVQRGLDVVSIQGLDDLTLPGGHEGDLLWWRSDGHTDLRCYLITEQHVAITVNGTVLNPDGSERPSVSQPTIQWREGYRYFRLSQTADDLFDAYRNMYLSFESLLSSIVPPRTRNRGSKVRPEPDLDWFKNAYGIIKSSLDECVDQGASDPVRAFYDEQYTAYRCSLFHAKSGEAILPGDISMRSQVSQALERLSRLVASLCEKNVLLFRQGGFITPFAFKQAIDRLKSGLIIGVTDSCDDPKHDRVRYRKTTVFSVLDAILEGAADPPAYLYSYLGRTNVTDMHTPIINAVATYVPDIPGVLTHGLIDTLDISGADKLEIVQTFSLSSQGQPKWRFKL